MVRTIIFFIVFIAFMLITLPLVVPYYLMRLLRLRKAIEAYMGFLLGIWANLLMFLTGCHFTVKGKENLPSARNVVFISNHQGNFDIPFILTSVGRIVGFIAKKELAFFPLLNLWMPVIGCLFIDRKSPRKALAVFQKAIEHVRDGHAMLVFPEGTRSRSDHPGEFKKGSLKLPLQAEAVIVPLTIDGTWHVFEEKKHIQSAKVTLTIHPSIDTKTLPDGDKATLIDRLRATIVAQLPKTESVHIPM